MVANKGGRTPQAERAALTGCCEQCGERFRGRVDKRFCSDRCRTRFGRERKQREMQERIAKLERLAGLRGNST